MSKRTKVEDPSDPVSGGGRRARKRLAEVVASLEKARAKRDKAQARVEALEALAETLAAGLAADAQSAVEERGRAEPDEDGEAAKPIGAKATSSVFSRAKRPPKRRAAKADAPATMADGAVADGAVAEAPTAPARKPARKRTKPASTDVEAGAETPVAG